MAKTKLEIWIAQDEDVVIVHRPSVDATIAVQIRTFTRDPEGYISLFLRKALIMKEFEDLILRYKPILFTTLFVEVLENEQ